MMTFVYNSRHPELAGWFSAMPHTGNCPWKQEIAHPAEAFTARTPDAGIRRPSSPLPPPATAQQDHRTPELFTGIAKASAAL